LKIANQNPDASFAVLPSDHVILKEDVFTEKMEFAFSNAEQGESLITLGIQPTRPDTGYGYIEVNHKDGAQAIEKVEQFKEKPDLKTAKKYLEAGNYFWNAGIFIWSVKSVLNAFEKNCPQVTKVLGTDNSKYNTPEEQEYIDEVYPKTEKISVDYALLERSNNVFTIPADIGWSDLGTWNSLHAYLPKDENENVMQGVILSQEDCKNSFIRLPKNKKAVIKGVKDMIVIDEGDVLLIYPKSDEQEIKAVRNGLEDNSVL